MVDRYNKLKNVCHQIGSLMVAKQEATTRIIILSQPNNLQGIYYTLTVFQLGLFLRALRPARTGLRPARFAQRLDRFKKIYIYIYYKKNVLFLPHVIAVFVFSDS